MRETGWYHGELSSLCVYAQGDFFMRAEKTKGVNGGICFLKTINGHINKHPACVSRQQSGEHEVVSEAVGNHQ